MTVVNTTAGQEDRLADRVRNRLHRHQHLIKYFLIGGTASAIDVGLFLALFNLADTSVIVAHTVSVSTAILFSFFVNARHNFHTGDRLALRLFSFVMVCGLGFVLGYLITIGVASVLDANIGKIVSLPFVFIFQYVLNSRITFRKVEK